MNFLIVVTVIFVVADVFVWRSIGGIVFIVICPFLGIKEGSPISVSNVKTFWIAERKTMDAIDNVLWER